ncbi:MAG: hypothetical protein QM597_05600, partial [Aeromicrobium sp.]|uniref:hypothetical protein n=1 Tax=Aeromicrobium sp. TaxID=1871063 RepID=UPI0039E3DF5F
MLRIIDGTPYLGKTADWVKVRAYDLGNGHLEVSGYRPIVWEEADWEPLAIKMAIEAIELAKGERDEEEHRELMARKAAQRAKKRVRRLCKVMGVNTLLTLTYRACETDLARCK